MSGIFRAMKYSAVALMAAVMLFAVALPAYADTGSVHFRVSKAGFIVGVAAERVY